LKRIRHNRFGIYEIPENIQKFRKFWDDEFKDIPDKYKDSITIEFDVYNDYGAASAEIGIYYEREKTETEIKEEKEKSHNIQKIKRQRQKEEYDRLKKIFEQED